MASVDSLEDNTGFANKNNANFPILADVTKTMSQSYGVLHAAGFAQRWTYYIDPEGIVIRIDKDTNPATAGADLVTSLKALGVPAAADWTLSSSFRS